MRFEECSICGIEFAVLDLLEPLNAYDEYTCRSCLRKAEDEE